MGDYEPQEFMDLFGGLRLVARTEVHLMTDEKPATCIICGQETHRIEEVARCVHELRRREKAE